MIPWSSVLTGFVLFWPAVLSLAFLGFCCIVFAVVLIGSTVLIVAIFVYGLYCMLRDLGVLDTLFTKIGTVSSYLSDHCKQNVKESFVVQSVSKSLPKGPALVVCHPHGLYGLTWFIHFAVALSEWPLEKRPVLAIHSVFFHLPIFRELMSSHNCIEAKEDSIVKTLQEGKSVALLVGGIEELHQTGTGSLRLVLKKRTGYARISQRCQVPLIPLICPEENHLFPAIQTFPWNWIQRMLYETWRIAIPIPSWTNLYSWISIAYKPFPKPLITYLLDPVYPDEKSIEDIKSEYEQRLLQFSKDSKIPLELVN